MDLVSIFAIMGLVVTKAVDFLRQAFDKDDRIPKAYWTLSAFAIGIGLAFVSCGVKFVHDHLGLPGEGCTDQVLVGMGFAVSGAFWHEVLSALSAVGGPAPTPKGLVPRAAGDEPS